MERNLGRLVLEASEKFGDDVAFQVRRGFRLERITFRQAGTLARKVAGWLRAKGVGPGERIAIWSPNMPEYALLYFGAWLGGVVAVPIDVRTPQDVVKRFVAEAAPRLGFKSRFVEGTFCSPAVETFELESLVELVEDTPPLEQFPDAGRDDLCEIAFTSGTTGVPKGVMLTHGNIVAEIEALHVAFPLKREYRALSILPLSHAFEQFVGLLLPFTSGVRVTYVARVNAVTIARAMREDQITCLAIVPELLRIILSGIERRAQQQGKAKQWQRAHQIADRLPYPARRLLFRQVHTTLGGHLLFFGCGGAPLDVAVAQAWERMGVLVFEGYGLTETSAATAINNRQAKRLGSVGKLVPGVEVKIAETREEAGGGAGDGQPAGEILIRGPTVTPGYFNRPDLTEQSFADGWFRSGDVGYFDDDGFLHISGRESFKIVLPDGRNVYPEDVERTINQHPLVKDSCVVGIERHGAEAVHAVLLTSAPERADEIVREVNRQLAAHQQITSHSVWPGEDFPRTATLKIDRRAVRQTVQRGQTATAERQAEAEPAPAAPAPAAADPLAGIVARVSSRPAGEVRDDAELEADLGLDSLGRVELLSMIEEVMGRVVDESKVGPQTTVGELRQLVLTGAGTTAGGRAGPARWPRTWWARALRRGLQQALFRLQDRWIELEVVHPERAAKIPLPSILIFNYQGPYAALLVLRALPPHIRSRVAIAADARLWEGRDRWQGLLGELAVQAFSFAKSGGAVRPSLEELGRWLDDGYAVIMSPEGNPEIGGELLPFLGGTGLMAVEMRVPVVPFKLGDYHRLFPPNPPFPYLPNKRGRVRLIVGEPVTFAKTMDYREATELARRALIETR
ncbi:MAG: AMP-binding protein [Chloroflexi bacterium]|nr:AMP-binding protein [Chloroflexota bacterium]